jgi:hypothetical protein
VGRYVYRKKQTLTRLSYVRRFPGLDQRNMETMKHFAETVACSTAARLDRVLNRPTLKLIQNKIRKCMSQWSKRHICRGFRPCARPCGRPCARPYARHYAMALSLVLGLNGLQPQAITLILRLYRVAPIHCLLSSRAASPSSPLANLQGSSNCLRRGSSNSPTFHLLYLTRQSIIFLYVLQTTEQNLHDVSSLNPHLIYRYLPCVCLPGPSPRSSSILWGCCPRSQPLSTGFI